MLKRKLTHESSCSHLNFRFRPCFEQGVPWHSGNYRVWFTLKRVRDMTRTYSQTKNRRKLWIWSHLLKKSLMENFIFCAVTLIWGNSFWYFGNLPKLPKLFWQDKCNFNCSYYFNVMQLSIWFILIFETMKNKS